MKVIIFGDMEGVAGISHWDQVTHGTAMYQEGRRLYTEELNAAVRGAFDGGATEVVVVDSHGAGAAGNMGGAAFNSLIPDLMDERCDFITHHGWANVVEELRSGVYTAAFFVGIHAMGLTPAGVLSHTVASMKWLRMRINGRPVGEIGIVAALCAGFGTPMALVTGDVAACEEATGLLGQDVVTAAVKRGLGRFSARHLSPARARRLIQEKARESLEGISRRPLYLVNPPVRITYELVTADVVDHYRNLQALGVSLEIEEPNLVHSCSDRSFLEAWSRLAPFPG